MNETTDRRQFLKILSASMVTAALPLSACSHKKFFNPDEEIVISGGSYKKDGEHQNALIIINLTQTEKRVIDTPFLPHDILIDSNDRFRIICLQKGDINACEINLQTKNVVSTFLSTAGRRFSGHAAFSRDSKTLFTVETANQGQQGYITVRDARTFEKIKQIATAGLRPHDCQLLDNNILMVSNTDGIDKTRQQASLVYIDLNSEKIINRLVSENGLNFAHFMFSSNQQLVIASASRDLNKPGGISIKAKGETLQTMSEPELVIERMIGEALGVAINLPNQVVAITHPEANLLTFWSLQNKKIIKAIGIESPRGINQTRDGKSFIVSYGNRPAMAKISTATIEPQADSIVQPTFTTGEHLINWSQRIREIMPTRIYG